MAWRRSPSACACGCTYDRFRTQLTFGAVRRMMWNQMDPNRPGWYRQKRRNSVLGYWRELKIAMFEFNHGNCADELQLASWRSALRHRRCA